MFSAVDREAVGGPPNELTYRRYFYGGAVPPRLKAHLGTLLDEALMGSSPGSSNKRRLTSASRGCASEPRCTKLWRSAT